MNADEMRRLAEQAQQERARIQREALEASIASLRKRRVIADIEEAIAVAARLGQYRLDIYIKPRQGADMASVYCNTSIKPGDLEVLAKYFYNKYFHTHVSQEWEGWFWRKLVNNCLSLGWY